VDQRETEGVAVQLKEAAQAERVILFGSHARGEPDTTGDVDLMMIAESDLPRFKRSRELYKALRPYPFAMDRIVFTSEEIEEGKKSPVSFVSTVL
jgi:predicted nucleotidyltransferase